MNLAQEKCKVLREAMAIKKLTVEVITQLQKNVTKSTLNYLRNIQLKNSFTFKSHE